ncbi:hypothetical protein NMY22_g2769 [Coprinellus aureogranulatus]|nr:hypothetical protein NMY22_g2769 [Coprinellus aureogranulatus]
MEASHRSTDMPANARGVPTRDTEYYFEDGSCIFLVENVLFNVHRSMLSRDGSSFGAMFSLPQGGMLEGKSDDNPIVLTGETATEFRHFLSALYALPPQLQTLTSPTANLTALISIARISNKYAFRTLEAWALEAIQDYVNRKPSPILSSIPSPTAYVYSPSDSADLSASNASASLSGANTITGTAQLTRLIRLAQLCGHTPLLNTMINFLRELMSNSLQYAYLALTLSDELGLKSLRGAAYLEVMHKAQIAPPLALDIGRNGQRHRPFRSTPPPYPPTGGKSLAALSQLTSGSSTPTTGGKSVEALGLSSSSTGTVNVNGKKKGKGKATVGKQANGKTDKPKPETYKQAWSVEEQHLLEQLLEEIPEGVGFSLWWFAFLVLISLDWSRFCLERLSFVSSPPLGSSLDRVCTPIRSRVAEDFEGDGRTEDAEAGGESSPEVFREAEEVWSWLIIVGGLRGKEKMRIRVKLWLPSCYELRVPPLAPLKHVTPAAPHNR